MLNIYHNKDESERNEKIHITHLCLTQNWFDNNIKYWSRV